MIAAGILPVGENSVIKYELIGMNKMKSFEEVFEDKTKYGTKIKTNEYQQEGKYLIVDQGQEQVAGYTNLEEGVFEEVPAIVFGDHTRVIKYVEEPFFLGADGVKVLKCRLPNANYKYLYYTLLNAKIPNTGYNRHFKWLKEIKIAYPNTEKQTEMVCILDKVSKIIEFRQQQLKKLDELVKSRFIKLFGDIVLNPFGWEKDYLGVVCDVRDGTHDSPHYHSTGFPLVTSKNVTGGEIDLTDCSLISKADFNKINERSKVDMGDIIMPMIGTVGKPVIVNVKPNFAIKNVSLIKFKDDSRVLNTFIRSLLQSDYFDDAVLSKVRGGTQKFISLGDIRKLVVIVPPMELQEQFAAFVEQTDKSKFVIQQALDKAQLLFDSLMQKFFG